MDKTAAPPDKTAATPMSTRDFSVKLHLLSESVLRLAQLEEAVNSVPKNEALRYKDTHVHKRDVGAFRTTLRNEIEGLRKDYDLALRCRKRVRSEGKHAVFVHRMKPEAMELVCSEASRLGNYNGKPLHEQLPLFRSNGLILNTAIMPLSSIYVRKNQMRSGAKLVATEHMHKVLAPFRSDLESRGLKFDSFGFTRWSTIWSVLGDPSAKQERRELLETHREQLELEAQLIGAVLKNLK